MSITTNATIRAATLVAVLAAVLTCSGAGSASAALPSGPLLPSGPRCTSPGGPGPGYNASIGSKQNGETVCLIVGEKLLVLLSAPPATGLSWGHVQVTPLGILTVAPLTLMLSRGLTGTNFLAAHPGVVELTSVRHLCSPAQSNEMGCMSLLLWRRPLWYEVRSNPIRPGGRNGVVISTGWPSSF